VVTQYLYDQENRLTDVDNSAGSSYHYTLRADGKRLAVTDSTGTTSYTYDPDGHLASETFPGSGPSLTYLYDNVGNRVSRTVTGATGSLVNGTTSYTYDPDDRITGEAGPSGSVSHTYDYDGDETTVNGQAASYDWENRLVGLGSGTSYLYDADGDRVAATASGTTTDYLVDTTLDFPSVVEERSTSGSLLARYTLGDDLIRMDRGSTASYYVFDGLGSTRALTNGSSVTDTYTYDAYGELVSQSHPGGVATQNAFLFDAQQFDASTGDYYLRARYYNEADGRFLSQDPLAGLDLLPVTLHRYLYGNVDPIDIVDPSGQEGEGGIAGAAIEAGVDTAVEGAEDEYGLAALNALVRASQAAARLRIIARFGFLLLAGSLTAAIPGSDQGTNQNTKQNGDDYVADSGIFLNRIGASKRAYIDTYILGKSRYTLFAPDAIIFEVVTNPSILPASRAMQLARLQGYPGGAKVIITPDVDISDINPDLLLGQFGERDAKVVATASILGLDVLTVNKRMKNQILTGPIFTGPDGQPQSLRSLFSHVGILDPGPPNIHPYP
jgi:RHS repeat-associated protein